ncbi:LytTR family transcriptional regulator DNA-binding domain-containing protein [Echinicola pacifica]|uniref:LytTR family transcriptional regulator DNA-binding domain-containing protein n=1 Tax=Echinicola pacifica TaxID=346377 RepID=UPI00035FF297
MKHLFLRNETECANIPIDAILSLEVKDYFLVCHTACGRSFSCCKALIQIENLHLPYFVRINRSTIINIHKIQLVNFKTRVIEINELLSYQMAFRKINLVRKAIREFESNT